MKQIQNFETFQAETQKEKEQFENQIADTEQALEQKEQLLQEAKNVSLFVSGDAGNQRNHRLIQKGVAVESACRDTELMSPVEFYNLADEIFNTEQIRQRVREILEERKKE